MSVDTSASYAMKLATTCGTIEIELDAGKAPHTVNSFDFLAGKGYFDHTKCHRLVDQGIYVLQCGDPKGTGSGSPGYTIPDENLKDPRLKGGVYPAGTVAMANRYDGQSEKTRDSGGSQFFLVYQDSQLPPELHTVRHDHRRAWTSWRRSPRPVDARPADRQHRAQRHRRDRQGDRHEVLTCRRPGGGAPAPPRANRGISVVLDADSRTAGRLCWRCVGCLLRRLPPSPARQPVGPARARLCRTETVDDARGPHALVGIMWRRRCEQRPVGPRRRDGDRVRAYGRRRAGRRIVAGGLPRGGPRLLRAQVRGPGRRDRPPRAPGQDHRPVGEGRHDRDRPSARSRSTSTTRWAIWTRCAKRLDKLVETVEARREERKAQKAKQSDEARQAKEKLVAEAEELAASEQWRAAGERLRALVDTWKGLPRLDRKADDELWHRFSHARSAFSKRRKAHFASLDAQREEARKAKEKLVAEAESLSNSTDWGADRGPLPRADGGLEGRRPRPARARGRPVEPLPRRAGRLLRRRAARSSRSATPSSRRT